MRYPGGASFSSASFSPALQYARPAFAAGVSGSFASLPDAAWSSQGRGDVWVASPPVAAQWRLAGEVGFGGTSRGDGNWSGAAQALAEVLLSRPQWGLGVGAGPSAGWINDRSSVTALHTRARAWWRRGVGPWQTDWSLSLEPTHFLGAWFTDAALGVTLERGSLIGSLWSLARISGHYGTTGAGSASLQLFLSPHVALEASAGSYLRDPYQGLPRAGFVTLGVRLHGADRDRPGPRWSPLVPEPRGDSLVVRFRFRGVRSVAMAGDWNEWHPVPLRELTGDVWEGTLALARGLYHFNLLVDGGEWVVPHGVATVADGLGGMVGVLLVP